MTALSMTPSMETLWQVDLNMTVDFTAEDSLEALADFLTTAKGLKLCKIKSYGGRAIKVEVTTNSYESEVGMVKITDKATGETIEREAPRDGFNGGVSIVQ